MPTVLDFTICKLVWLWSNGTVVNDNAPKNRVVFYIDAMVAFRLGICFYPFMPNPICH